VGDCPNFRSTKMGLSPYEARVISSPVLRFPRHALEVLPNGINLFLVPFRYGQAVMLQHCPEELAGNDLVAKLRGMMAIRHQGSFLVFGCVLPNTLHIDETGDVFGRDLCHSVPFFVAVPLVRIVKIPPVLLGREEVQGRSVLENGLDVGLQEVLRHIDMFAVARPHDLAVGDTSVARVVLFEQFPP
jgi:hypothetical protein